MRKIIIPESRGLEKMICERVSGEYFENSQENRPEYFVRMREKRYCRMYAYQKRYDLLKASLRKIIKYTERDSDYQQEFRVLILDLVQILFKENVWQTQENYFYMLERNTCWKKVLGAEVPEQACAVLDGICSQIEDPQKAVQYNRYIINSLNYIFHHYSEDIALETVASYNNISSFYLSRLFKQEMNCTFLKILTNVRIGRAIDLLYEQRYSVQQISEMCGYMNTSYFYKLFKKQTGMTIGEMKNRIGHTYIN